MNPLESSALGLSELLEKRFTLGDKASSILPPKGGTMNYPALATLSGCVLLLASAAAQTKPVSSLPPLRQRNRHSYNFAGFGTHLSMIPILERVRLRPPV